MDRSKAVAGVLAWLLTLGLSTDALAQERAKLAAEATCIDAADRYAITWTLTLTLGDQETATAETEMSDFEGLDLIGQPQSEGYPFQAEGGNLFTGSSGRLANRANVARTEMDTNIYDPDVLTAMGRIVTSTGSTMVEASAYRPTRCAA